jgi:hypothetical protein
MARTLRALGALTKKSYQDCAGFSSACKARKGAHSQLCNPLRNTAGGRKDKQDGNFFSRNRLSLGPTHRPLADVQDITTEHLYCWLAAGWKDLRSTPAANIGYGVLFLIASYLVTLVVVFNQWFFLLLPLLGGFFLVAPALGSGLYEISRQLERGERPTLARALTVIRRNAFHITSMGAFLAVVLLAWIMVANLVFVGLAQGITPSFGNALGYLFSPHNLPMLVVGTAVGANLRPGGVRPERRLRAYAGGSGRHRRPQRHADQRGGLPVQLAPHATVGGADRTGHRRRVLHPLCRARHRLPADRARHLARLSGPVAQIDGGSR